MVKIYHPNPANIATRPRNRTNGVDQSALINKEKQDLPVGTQFVERRKTKSDRREKKAERGPFDMRSGRRDRRRNSDPANPTIDIEV